MIHNRYKLRQPNNVQNITTWGNRYRQLVIVSSWASRNCTHRHVVLENWVHHRLGDRGEWCYFVLLHVITWQTGVGSMSERLVSLCVFGNVSSTDFMTQFDQSQLGPKKLNFCIIYVNTYIKILLISTSVICLVLNVFIFELKRILRFNWKIKTFNFW